MMKNWQQSLKFVFMALWIQACSSNNYVPEEPAELIDFEHTAKLEIDWQQSVGSGVGDYYSKLNPAIGYGFYFVADRESVISAFHAQTGQRVWQTDILAKSDAAPFQNVDSARLASGIAVGRNKVFVGSEHGALTALDAKSGQIMWSQSFAGELLSKPLLVDHLVVVHATSGVIYAFDVETGKKAWEYYSALAPLTLRGTSEPIAQYGGVIFGTAEGKMVVLSSSTGQAAWSRQITVPKGSNDLERICDIDAKALVVNQNLYVLGFNGHLSALNIRTGDVIWQRDYSGFNTMAVAGSSLFFTDARDTVIAVDRRTGQELWRNKEFTLRGLTAPAVAKGVVIVGDYAGYVHVLDQRTGSTMARIRVDNSGLLGQPLITEENKVLIQSRDGDIARIVIQL